jgi:beta-hydroxylase
MATDALAKPRRPQILKWTIRIAKRLVPLALGLWLVPGVLLFFVVCGLLDVLRNQHRTPETIDRYFAGNGICTWLLSPFNLLMDLLCLPSLNRGVYELEELPKECQEELGAVVEAAYRADLVGQLQEKLGDAKRGMVFFKWYGQDVHGSIHVPEYHRPMKYVKTVGVSVFNKKASTGKHYGPLRVTLRVLYNINDITDPSVYIKVGNKTHRWCRDGKMFIFDDTLQHQSCNGSDAPRYCLFIDILRPGPLRPLRAGILSCLRFVLARFNFVFFQHWTFLK